MFYPCFKYCLDVLEPVGAAPHLAEPGLDVLEPVGADPHLAKPGLDVLEPVGAAPYLAKPGLDVLEPVGAAPHLRPQAGQRPQQLLLRKFIPGVSCILKKGRNSPFPLI